MHRPQSRDRRPKELQTTKHAKKPVQSLLQDLSTSKAYFCTHLVLALNNPVLNNCAWWGWRARDSCRTQRSHGTREHTTSKHICAITPRTPESAQICPSLPGCPMRFKVGQSQANKTGESIFLASFTFLKTASSVHQGLLPVMLIVGMPYSLCTTTHRHHQPQTIIANSSALSCRRERYGHDTGVKAGPKSAQ
jgi:hypothetical protein